MSTLKASLTALLAAVAMLVSILAAAPLAAAASSTDSGANEFRGFSTADPPCSAEGVR